MTRRPTQWSRLLLIKFTAHLADAILRRRARANGKRRETTKRRHFVC